MSINAGAHREPPKRGHSAFSEPPPGDDAVESQVSCAVTMIHTTV